jgi:RNA polymerase sigma-70 factor, ECF subfamily
VPCGRSGEGAAGRGPAGDEALTTQTVPGGSDADQASAAADLVRRIRAGDRRAEGELVERFSRGLSLMLRRLTADPALAEDVHQETFRLVVEKARGGEIHHPERFAGFLRSTARNLLIADRRKEARYTGLGEGDEAFDRLRPAEPEPQLQAVMREEEAKLVRTLLAELRFDRDRELLLRFYLSDDGKEAICADLGVDPQRFNRVLFRARQRLRELWERAEKRRRLMTAER